MRIGIIGAGFTGLTAGYRLIQQGHNVTIFEKESKPGGLALGFKEKGWEWSLEEYYHHWFTNDDNVLNLAKELNYPVIIKRPKSSSFIDNATYQLDSPITFLLFRKLSVFERLRMAMVLGFIRYDPFWQPLEKLTATDFLSVALGKRAYNILWEPLLRGKFGEYADTISLAWFWARISKRTTSLAYPEGGFLKFTEKLAIEIERQGSNIHYNTSIGTILEKNDNISLGEFGEFDKLIVTLPSFAFVKLFPQLPKTYKEKLTSLKGLGAQVMVLRLRESFLTDGTYWLNICDFKAPMLAIVEHTNFMDKKYYNNEHLVYVGNYLPQKHPYFSLSAKELLKVFHPFLKKLNNTYKKNLIGTELFNVPFAQPIIPINYSGMIPPFETPIKNVYLANMQQVYPWDRGTNYAVELGEKIAKVISNS